MCARRAISLAAVILLVFAASTWAQDQTGDDFPLTPGTYWVYRGIVRSWAKGSATGKTTQITWRTTVTRAVRRDGFTVAVVKGLPGDLDWSEGNAEPKLSILIRTRDARFYLLEGDEAKSVLREFDNPHYSWQQLPIDDDWFLQLPLAEGKKFCDAQGMKREDGEYCWVTGPAHDAHLAGVKGIQPGRHVGYRVEYLTNPDDMEFDFVAGIGMVSYEYHHHGTTADTELHLIEFHKQEGK
jgi:hypothetical protein